MTDTRVTYERSAAPPAVTESFAVDVCGLRMSYGSTEVLRGVDFDVRYGEVFCLLGPNGAGQNHDARDPRGLPDADRRHGSRPRPRPGGAVGQASRAGRDGPAGVRLSPAGPGGRAHRHCGGAITRTRARSATCSSSWSSPRTGTPRSASCRAASGAAWTSPWPWRATPTWCSSTSRPPASTRRPGRRCWAAIENLRRLGKTILLTTHYLDEAEQLADRIAILRAGRIELAGTTHEVAVRAGLATRISFTTPRRCAAVRSPCRTGSTWSSAGRSRSATPPTPRMTLRLAARLGGWSTAWGTWTAWP